MPIVIFILSCQGAKYCEQTQSEEQRSFKLVYSMDADDTKSITFYIRRRQVNTEWGVNGREGEREKEKRIKGVRDGA
jgi:hypothetical protein